MSDVILPVQTKYLQVNKVTIKSDKLIHSFFFLIWRKAVLLQRSWKIKERTFLKSFMHIMLIDSKYRELFHFSA